jgi:succinate dehydrogenase / fumarate reductase, cytochrome b subunit
MSTATSPATSVDARTARATFFRSRLASFLAVVPLSVWVFIHLWHNLAAFDGAEAWQSAVTEYPHPIAQLATGLVVLLPLALHSAWGITRLFTSRPNNVRYGFYGNTKYLFQRLSAIGLLLFLGAHLWLAMLHPRLQEGHAETFADIAHEMHHHGPTLVVYILGVLGIAYHLANGLQTFAMGWGLVSSKRALRRLEGVSIAVMVTLLALGYAVVYALWVAGT